MTDLTQLWHKRLRYFINELGKYGRLIFNDHFSIVLVILMGFGGFFYKEQLTQLQALEPATVRIPLLAAVVFLLVIVFNIGRPIWLTRDPDKSYLFAQGKAWHNYWLRGLSLGLVLPAFLLVGMVILVAPFLALVSAWQLTDLWLLVALLVLLKAVSYLFLYLNLFRVGFGVNAMQHNGFVAIVLFTSFVLPAPIHQLWLAGIVSGLLILALWRMRQRSAQMMQFNDVLEQEALRESTFYKWVSIFADVPHLQPSIKRRAFLDASIEWLSKKMPNRYSYLYLRVLFRNNAYSGIWVRVMLFIAVLILLTEHVYLAVGLGIMGYILTIVQLVPVIYLYDTHPFQRLYPEQKNQQATAFQYPIIWIFALQTSVYMLALLGSFGWTMTVLWLIAIWLVVAALIVWAYIPWWTRKPAK